MLPKIVLTVSINCSSDLKIFANCRPSALNFKSFSRSLEQFFLTVGQNNFGNKIPLLFYNCSLQALWADALVKHCFLKMLLIFKELQFRLIFNLYGLDWNRVKVSNLLCAKARHFCNLDMATSKNAFFNNMFYNLPLQKLRALHMTTPN